MKQRVARFSRPHPSPTTSTGNYGLGQGVSNNYIKVVVGLILKYTLRRLTVGPAIGSIKELFTKVNAINAKHGKFELLICVGDFFGASDDGSGSPEVEELLNGQIEGTPNQLCD